MPRCKKTVTLAVLAFWPVLAAAQVCKTQSILATTPTHLFTSHNDGTVTDSRTGLMWQQCSVGQSGAACSGKAVTYTWQDALHYAQNLNANGGFAGYTDWRLPNIKELSSIVEDQCVDPAINATVFPNTPSRLFWSSSPVADVSYDAWYVIFLNGVTSNDDKDSGNYVRLVR